MYFGVRPARTTLSEQAMHSMQSGEGGNVEMGSQGKDTLKPRVLQLKFWPEFFMCSEL